MPGFSLYRWDRHVETACRAAHEVMQAYDQAHGLAPEVAWLELPDATRAMRKLQADLYLRARARGDAPLPAETRQWVWRAALLAASNVQQDWGGDWYGK